MQACAGSTDGSTAKEPIVAAEIYKTPAEQEYFQSKTSQHYAQYQDALKSNADDFLLGVSSFGVAQNSGSGQWSSIAQKHFERARGANSKSAVLKSYEGAAYALMARDYPLRGLWMAAPGPGFQRLAYVDLAVQRLDDAATQAPNDPIVRLLRAAVYSGFPKVFGMRQKGLDEFPAVMKMIENADGNSIAATPEYQLQAYVNYALSLELNGDPKRARGVWATLLDRFPETPEGRLARQKLAGGS